MRAALYARKSTDERQATSLQLQTSEAREYAKTKGWTIDDRHVFVEEAVSRAEFVKRPAWFALQDGAKRGDFDVVIVRDETRIGGDTERTGLWIVELLETGCRLFFYFEDFEVDFDKDPSKKLLLTVKNLVAEQERIKISQRTREHLFYKAKLGPEEAPISRSNG